MAKQYLAVKTFGGYNRGSSDLVPYDQLVSVDNMWGKPDYASGNLLGILSKIPHVANYKKVLPAAGRARGLYFWNKDPTNVAEQYIFAWQCTTDYTVGKLYIYYPAPTDNWFEIYTDANPYHADFETDASTKLYWTNMGYIRKWMNTYTPATQSPKIKDKGGTAVAIAGATLTWNLTNTVTSDIDISASIDEGDWIRKSSTSNYWDEVIQVAAGGLSMLLETASSENGASAAGGAEKAADNGPGAMQFLKVWKGKLWALDNINLYWSVSADFEDFTSTGAGSLSINPDGSFEYSAGLAFLDEYLFVFRNDSYLVYRWTGDATLPVELVKIVNQGCSSERTIQNVGEALIYFTGSDVRMANGSQDISIASPQLIKSFQASWQPGSYTYFTKTAADNTYPFAVYDDLRRTYTLFKPTSTSGNGYIYDTEKGIWIGSIYPSIVGDAIVAKEGTGTPVIIYSTITSTNQLKYFHRTTLDYTNGVVLFSPAFDFGEPEKKKKINWIEFVFHPKVNCDTTLKFNWWDFDETKTTPTAGSTGEQTYNLASSGASAEQRVRKRFYVNAEMYKFGWTMLETVGGTEGWGLIEYTICYEVMETT